MNKKNHKKRNTAVFIDSENISSKKASDIMREAKKRGVVDRVNAYGIQKDKSTQSWAKVARETEGMKDIRLYGGPVHNNNINGLYFHYIHCFNTGSSQMYLAITTKNTVNIAHRRSGSVHH